MLRGPKNRFLRCPARKKVLESPLNCPKTTHKHYGTLRWGPWSTTGPSKADFVNFALFYLKPSQNALPKPPALPGAILRGPKNRFLRCPARKKVIERLLECPKTTQKHYGTLPWGPWSTMGPSKSNFVNFALFQLNLPYKTAQTPAGLSCEDPKTGLWGSQQVKR